MLGANDLNSDIKLLWIDHAVMYMQVMVLTHDAVKGRLSLSTRKLEPTPGDMIKNPSLVFEKADEMAKEFR